MNRYRLLLLCPLLVSIACGADEPVELPLVQDSNLPARDHPAWTARELGLERRTSGPSIAERSDDSDATRREQLRATELRRDMDHAPGAEAVESTTQPRWLSSSFEEIPLEPKRGIEADCEPEEVSVVGTPLPDFLLEGSADRCLVGLGGKDTLVVGGGADDSSLLGGTGRDTLVAGATVASTRMGGGDGQDLMVAYGGVSAMWGQRGADDLYGGYGDDLLDGGPGADVLDGYGGHDILAGGPGPDSLLGGWGDDELRGEAGHDWLLGDGWGQWGEDELSGGTGDDWLEGRGGADVLTGGSGDDVLFGGAGPDELRGGPGNDYVHAGSGDDVVYIDGLCEIEPGEVVRGGPGHDTLVTPVPLETLGELGVLVLGFEEVEIAQGEADCDRCGCVLDGGAVECCSGSGTCDLIGEPEGVACQCNEGLIGPDCSVDPSLTYFDEPQTVGCMPGDPSCVRSFEADEYVIPLEDLDWDQFPQCQNLDFLVDLDPIPPLDGVVYYPSQGPGQWAVGEFLLVLVSTGNGFDVADYAELATHLARNGYVAVVTGPQNDTSTILYRADVLVCMSLVARDIIVEGSPIGDHVTAGFSVLGHSRGGEAALVATSYLGELGEVTPQAVVSLAPTGRCLNEPEGFFAENTCGVYGFDGPTNPTPRARAALDDGLTRGLLVMEGSQDGDRTGEGISVYENASREQLGGAVPPDGMVKAMLWAFIVPHAAWARTLGGQDLVTASPARGQLLGRAYTVAFFDWLVRDLDGRQFFTGDDVPGCVADPESCAEFEDEVPPVFFQQFREAGTDLGGRHLPLRTFEADPGLGQDAFGDLEGRGAPIREGDITQFWRNTFDPDATSERTFLVGGSAELGSLPGEPATLTLPLAGDGFSPVDAIAQGYSHLSLRVGLALDGPAQVPPLSDAECAAFGEANSSRRLTLDVSVVDAFNNTATVSTQAFREVAAADVGRPPGNQNGCEFYAFWTTVRVPLSAFAGIVRTQLTSITITLDADDPLHQGMALRALVDSIELVGNDADGVCGNGVKDGAEFCDGDDLGGLGCEDFGLVGNGLSCSDACTLDESECSEPGGDCPQGTPGCPGGDCLEVPTGPGAAAYFQDGRYCLDETSICREDAPNVFSCHDCLAPEDSGEGCPCDADDDCGPQNLTCVGSVPDLPGIDTSVPGACFADAPGDHCLERCGATDRVCGSLLGVDAVCIIDACGPPCELSQPGTVCDRDSGQCVAACVGDFECADGQVCAQWGECWG